jgi:chemotaxis protein methyltransferase CheR
MNSADFDFLATLLKDGSGLVLTPDKAYLLESRLAPVARKHGFGNIDELVRAMRGPRKDVLGRDVIEAMTTNESFFFRDIKPFDIFRTLVLPEIMQRRAAARSIRIWCAAAATGQEPYTLAMVLHEEAAKLAGWQTSILATDISLEALEKAKAGLYTQFEVQRGLSIQRLVKYFTQEGQHWRIKPELRQMVQYRQFNLLTSPKLLGTFDVVFCRNVLIYFDQPTKGKVLEAIAGVMEKESCLFLGGAETVFGITNAFEPVPGHHGVYRVALDKNSAAAPVRVARL